MAVSVLRHFPAVPWVGLLCVMVVYPGHANARIQRGQGVWTPTQENHNNLGFLAILVRIPWKITLLPIQHALPGYHRCWADAGTLLVLYGFSALPSSTKKLDFRESEVSPGQTEVKQGKFVDFFSCAKGYFRETYKSQNINPISPTTQGCV